MAERISEIDLLELIEGELPETRALEIRAALAADPDLARMVDAMRNDRDLLRSLPAPRTPAGLVAAAIDEAERGALLDQSPVLARVGSARAGGIGGWGRYAAAAAAVALVGGVGLLALSQQRPAPAPQTFAAKESAPQPALADPESSDAAQPGRPTLALRDATSLDGLQMRDAAPAPAPAMTVAAERTTAGLPLGRAIEMIDRHAIDWDAHAHPFLTVVVDGHERTLLPRRPQPAPTVTPSSYADALALASLNRLSVRVATAQPDRVGRALEAFRNRADRDVRMTSRMDTRGRSLYSVEMDREESEMGLLLDAIRGAASERGSTYFDVALAPASASADGLAAPVQISGRRPRVSLPVVIEPAGLR